MDFTPKILFNDIDHGCRAAVLKKNYLWLLPFYMVVATYRTAIVSSLFNPHMHILGPRGHTHYIFGD